MDVDWVFAGEEEKGGCRAGGLVLLSASLLYIGKYFFESPQTLGVGD